MSPWHRSRWNSNRVPNQRSGNKFSLIILPGDGIKLVYNDWIYQVTELHYEGMIRRWQVPSCILNKVCNNSLLGGCCHWNNSIIKSWKQRLVIQPGIIPEGKVRVCTQMVANKSQSHWSNLQNFPDTPWSLMWNFHCPESFSFEIHSFEPCNPKRAIFWLKNSPKVEKKISLIPITKIANAQTTFRLRKRAIMPRNFNLFDCARRATPQEFNK